MATLNNSGLPLTRASSAGAMAVGTVGWIKDGHLVILIKKTSKGYRRVRVFSTCPTQLHDVGWWPQSAVSKNLFQIPPLEGLIPNNRVTRLVRSIEGG